MLKIYNTLSRKLENFQPIRKNEARIYSCGPTVYSYQHIGNLRSYIFPDILKRILIFNGFKVKHVINVTDVGHLTSNADSGEDKIEKAAEKEHKTAKEISNYYWKVFKDDFKKLNIKNPEIWSKATDHIKEQMELIKKLERKGYTYKTSDGIYFNTSKFKNYGKLARIENQKLKAGKRVAMGEKKHATDFALWKFSPTAAGVTLKRQQEWKSSWGIGFPGWHIECSAMSMKYLGKHFDIHTGGEDHVPIHHTNEIAQSETATGKKFVNYWMHGAFLLFKGEKISKSKGGLYTISELEKIGINPLAFRYLCLGIHYRKPLDFSLTNLQNAENAYKKMKNIVLELKKEKGINQKYLSNFKNAINDDLNTPQALAILWQLLKDKKALGKIGAIKETDKILGLDLLKKEKIIIPKNITALVQTRETARKNKDWLTADKLRIKIKELGWQIKDTSSGPKLTVNN